MFVEMRLRWSFFRSNAIPMFFDANIWTSPLLKIFFDVLFFLHIFMLIFIIFHSAFIGLRGFSSACIVRKYREKDALKG